MIRGSGQGGVGDEMILTRTRTRTSDSRKTFSSERGTINGVAAVKDGTATETMPYKRRHKQHSRRPLEKQASPYQYIENQRQHMRANMANIEAVVFALLYPGKRAKFETTVPTVLDVEIRGRIPALHSTHDDNGDPRRLGTVTTNVTVKVRQALGARVREVGRRGVGSAGSTSSFSIIIKVDVENFTTSLPTVAS